MRRWPLIANWLPAPGCDLAAAGAVDGLAFDRLALEQALSGLAPETRAIVWLHLVEGYGHDEIGQMFDRTPSFSKSQLSRGLRRLRESLAPAPSETCHARPAAAL
jgi:RNA polymerase sigma-70 factor (ECF subfamily)